MRDGMYHVIFSSAQGAGEGLAVFKGESVNGGDDGYLYTGPKTQKGDAFKSTLTIKKWKQDAQSIFGNVQQFTLNLRDTLSASQMRGSQSADAFSPSWPSSP